MKRVWVKGQQERKRHTSKKTNNKTVLGPKRMKAGVQPLKRNVMPSSRMERARTCDTGAFEDWITIAQRLNGTLWWLHLQWPSLGTSQHPRENRRLEDAWKCNQPMAKKATHWLQQCQPSRLQGSASVNCLEVHNWSRVKFCEATCPWRSRSCGRALESYGTRIKLPRTSRLGKPKDKVKFYGQAAAE